MSYTRVITPVGKEFIADHYQLSKDFGAPKPPLIDHQGIDDAFESASIVLYLHKGKWLQLAGAD